VRSNWAAPGKKSNYKDETVNQTHILPPDPARMIEGLRDTGYEFNTAVADIIDNSIAAEATRIDLRITMDYRGNVQVAIADNGIGMGRDGLLDAMKYGSPRRANAASLGKFGLGLKTASTAFCRKLSVLTRPSAKDPILQATWDLDHVVKAGKWELLLPDPNKEGVQLLEETAKEHSGTVVLWDKLDRLFPKQYADPAGKAAQNALGKAKRELAEHIALVYQRFLDPTDNRARNVEIFVDGAKVSAWDPYCEGESEVVAEEKAMEVELPNGKIADFRVRAFILPRREEFKNEEAAKRAHITNDRQGIYIYRENRLIHDADWLGMFQKEPHFSLIRVEFTFDHRLDDAFHVDIKKSRILLNETLFNWLRDEFLPAPRRAAEQRYRKGQKKKINEATGNAHDSSNASIATKEDELDTAKISVINKQTGDVEITNKEGKVRLRLKISSAQKPGQCFVDPVESIDDGMLWEPALIDGHKAVRLNRGHPYYHKVYVPNLSSGVTVQGMDSLVWALCAAELGTVNDASKRHFAELRFEVSRLLRRLVDDLPEPDIEADDQAA
jgi:histidine kinase/DNA gyrase B/HSP90-like ATPase